MKYRPKATRSLVPLSIVLAKLSGPYPPADSKVVDPRACLKGSREMSCPTDIPPSIASFSLALLNSSKRGSIRCLRFSDIGASRKADYSHVCNISFRQLGTKMEPLFHPVLAVGFIEETKRA
jgi:hypothetical protein